MRTRVRVIVFYIINQLIKLKIFMKFFNFIYERVPYKIVELSRHIKIPNKSFNWKILLLNKKVVISKIHKNNPKTWHIALSYKWHDPSLNYIELVITNYLKDKNNAYWIDCGANLGLRSLTALSMNIKTFMIEPNEELNLLNQERCEQNKFTNFEILKFGVSNSNSEKKLFIDKSSYMSCLDESLVEKSKLDRIEIINLRKLDTLFKKELEFDQFDAFIKMDIEGHEKEALEGAQKLIAKHSPTLLIEINSKGEHAKSLIDNMRKQNYTVYITMNSGVTKNGFIKTLPNNLHDYTYNSSDFLFVKNSEINDLLSKFILN